MVVAVLFVVHPAAPVTARAAAVGDAPELTIAAVATHGDSLEAVVTVATPPALEPSGLAAPAFEVRIDGEPVVADVVRADPAQLDVALMVDTSPALTADGFFVTVSAAAELVLGLPAESSLAVLGTGDEPPAADLTQDRNAILRGLEALVQSDRDELAAGTDTAAQLLDEGDGGRDAAVALLAADSLTGDGAAALHSLAASGVPVYVVAVGGSTPVATPPPGLRTFPAAVDDLVAAVDGIAARLTSQYVVRVDAVGAEPATLEVRVAQDGVALSDRVTLPAAATRVAGVTTARIREPSPRAAGAPGEAAGAVGELPLADADATAPAAAIDQSAGATGRAGDDSAPVARLRRLLPAAAQTPWAWVTGAVMLVLVVAAVVAVGSRNVREPITAPAPQLSRPAAAGGRDAPDLESVPSQGRDRQRQTRRWRREHASLRARGRADARLAAAALVALPLVVGAIVPVVAPARAEDLTTRPLGLLLVACAAALTATAREWLRHDYDVVRGNTVVQRVRTALGAAGLLAVTVAGFIAGLPSAPVGQLVLAVTAATGGALAAVAALMLRSRPADVVVIDVTDRAAALARAGLPLDAAVEQACRDVLDASPVVAAAARQLAADEPVRRVVTTLARRAGYLVSWPAGNNGVAPPDALVHLGRELRRRRLPRERDLVQQLPTRAALLLLVCVVPAVAAITVVPI